MADWTDKDIQAFVQHVRELGGDVKLPVKTLKDGGIEATIARPHNEPEGWGAQVLRDYDRKLR